MHFRIILTAVRQTDIKEQTPSYTGPDEGHFTLQLLYRETARESGWQVQHPPIILTVTSLPEHKPRSEAVQG